MTGRNAVAYIRAAGFDALPGGLDTAAYRHAYGQRAGELVGLTPEQRLVHAFVYGALGAAAPAMLTDLLPIAERLQPDVIVGNEGEWAAEVVASKLGSAHVLHGFGAPKSNEFGQRLTPALGDLYAANGLPARTPTQRAADIYIDIWPRAFKSAPTTWWYPNVWPMRPDHILPRAGVPPRPAVLVGMPFGQTVYVTAGTTYNRRAGSMFSTVIDALREEPVNVIATVGPDGDTKAFDPRPPHIRVEKFVPQVSLLPHCAAAICHAGAGTVLGAMAHGVPVLVLMLQVAADHYEVASQVEASGAGLSLSADDLSADAVRGKLNELLVNPRYRLAAQRIGEEMASMPTPRAVADAFTQLQSLPQAQLE